MVKVECIFEARAQLGECPVWDPVGEALFWVDSLGRTLNRFDPATGAAKSWPMPADIGCCVLRDSGGLVVGLRGGFSAFDPETASLTPLRAVEPDSPNVRLNDGRCDRAGRFWSGTVRIPPVVEQPSAALYCLDTDLTCRRKLGGLLISNGLAFSPDDRTLYLSDSHPSVQTIWAFDFDLATAAIGNRREFANTRGLAGRPDGAAVDAEGCYWIALVEGGRIARFTPDGRLDREVVLPVSHPTMCAFGGADLATMFVTSMRPANVTSDGDRLSGGLFAFDPGVVGLPEPGFRG